MKKKPSYIAPFGDGFPGCLLVLPGLMLSWLRSLLCEMWGNSGEMCDPENYAGGGWNDGLVK